MDIKSFSSYLSESFVNALDTETKERFKDQVWKILQRSYQPIGGIKGNGFSSPDEMVREIPFWKMDVINQHVTSVVMYKDRNGRKAVAVGTDGSPRGKKKVIEMLEGDITLRRAYGEQSKSSLGLVLKLFPKDVIIQYLLTPEQANQLVDEDVIPISRVKDSELPDDAKLALSKYPFLREYGYLRELGGALHFKVMIGTPRKTIR